MPQRRRFDKNATDVRRFRLVARSQNDGRAEDPEATPLVLEPYYRPNDARRSGLTEEELLQAPPSLASKFPEVFADPNAPPDAGAGDGSDEEGEEEEEDLEGDCYFPKDGYNYDQHLKRVSGTGKGGGVVGVVIEAKEKVPEKEFKVPQPSTTEEQEVMRALEMADEYDELEDGALQDLIPGGVVDEDLQIWGPSVKETTNLPDLAAFKAMHAARMAGMGALPEGEDGEDFDEDEEGDSQAGDRRRPAVGGVAPSSAAAASAAEFEEFFAAEYGEEADVGALDDEEVEGPMSLDNVENVVDEFLEDQQKEKEHLTSIHEPQPNRSDRLDDVPRVIEETRAIIEKHYSKEVEGEEGDETSSGEDETEESKTWDCESVLSTLSNLSNRPGRIGKIKLIKKPEAMKTVKEQEEKPEEESETEGIVELPDVCNERKKDETPEEKKQRKAAVKEMRRICRQMKKESKETYRIEAAKLPGNKPGTGDIRPNSRTFRM